MKRKPLPKHWYKITIHECPICGAGGIWRERQFTPRPEDKADRYEWYLIYDYCDALC